MSSPSDEVARRRTFAIISHPDAGKTTLTEKLLLFGGAIQLAGTVKGRKAARHATSDWMRLEQQRGISVTSSVMQFPYAGRVINLLDTPGHEDFSEDTYRTLTAVDSALMVIDCAKGVEERTIKLMEVCRLRDTPIMTFINKLDREGREPLTLLDEIEKVLGIGCAPVTWPIGMGRDLRGIYHLLEDRIYVYQPAEKGRAGTHAVIDRLASDEAGAFLGDRAAAFRDEIELVRGASHEFSHDGVPRRPADAGVLRIRDQQLRRHRAAVRVRRARARRRGRARPPGASSTRSRTRSRASCSRSRRTWIPVIATGSRSCASAPGDTRRACGSIHVRLGKEMRIADALTFLAADRQHTDEAWAGDIIGLHNHGTINIGDSFTEGERLMFTGIPNFAPEMFRRVVLRDPLRMKALQKGLDQLCEEGATQLFRPLRNNDLILGAVGPLQFDVVAFRLADEYGVQAGWDNVNVHTARWVQCADPKKLQEFRAKAHDHLALDHAGALVYLAPSRVNLQLTQERWPDVSFRETREQLAHAA